MIAGSAMLSGTASGRALVLDEPLSFWGGVDSERGAIIDQRHPQVGIEVTGAVVVMPVGRGSSSASTVLAETIRLGTGPAALVLERPDPILMLGAWVARALYGIVCPVVVAPDALSQLVTGDAVAIGADGSITVTSATGDG